LLSREAGADGVFLISHGGADYELLGVAGEAKHANPDFRIGVNLLTWAPDKAAALAYATGLDMAWADDMGVDSKGLSTVARGLAVFKAERPSLGLFASVAFKYRAAEPDPALAAQNALAAGFIRPSCCS
jgi:hypothetical protein